MSNITKYYSIKSYEWLLPTGDASKLLVRYSTADDDQGVQNSKDFSIVIGLYRNRKRDAKLKDKTDKAKLIISFLKERIENAIMNAAELPSDKMEITSYTKDFPTNPDVIELRLGEWHKVVIERKMGFLSS